MSPHRTYYTAKTVWKLLYGERLITIEREMNMCQILATLGLFPREVSKYHYTLTSGENTAISFYTEIFFCKQKHF